MAERQDIQFISNGVTCRGWFYKSTMAQAEKAPCVVLAHGFCGVKELRLDAYAERFAEAGYHALVFDYRHFGSSDGEPRQILDITKQHQDWVSAVRFARSLPTVDPKKIILWGTSFSGGHVLAIASKDKQIAAVISQVPHINGFATAMAVGFVNNIRLGFAGFKDVLRMLFGLSPYYIPAFGRPGDLAAMTAKGEYEASRGLFPETGQFNENVAARIFLSFAGYSPGKYASKVTAPLLVQVGIKDVTTPSAPTIKAAEKAPRGELITYDLGHFDVYVQPDFERTIGDQLAFLKKHIG